MSSSEHVAGEFVAHFQSLLGTGNHVDLIESDILNVGSKLDVTQTADLFKGISNEDIKKALFSIDDKSPGPDMYTSHCFKTIGVRRLIFTNHN